MTNTPIAQQVLQEELEAVRHNIYVDGYNMGIGELLSMYKDRELVIHPDENGYVDLNSEQKTRIIENLLIGLPAPSITVVTDRLGRWELIEGEQWLKAVFQFVGVIPNRRNFRLKNPKILKSAEGFAWGEDVFVKTPEKFLDMNQRIDIKRAKVRVNIVGYRDNQPAREYYN